MRKRVNVVVVVDIITTMTKNMNTTMRKNAAVVAAVNITIMNMKLMSMNITMRKNVAVVVDIITTMTKSMNTIMTISRSTSTTTTMRSVNAAVAVDIITTMTKSMNIIMKQWSMSLVLCRQV